MKTEVANYKKKKMKKWLKVKSFQSLVNKQDNPIQSNNPMLFSSGKILHAVNFAIPLAWNALLFFLFAELLLISQGPAQMSCPLWHQPQLSKLSLICPSKSTLYMYLPLPLLSF